MLFLYYVFHHKKFCCAKDGYSYLYTTRSPIHGEKHIDVISQGQVLCYTQVTNKKPTCCDGGYIDCRDFVVINANEKDPVILSSNDDENQVRCFLSYKKLLRHIVNHFTYWIVKTFNTSDHLSFGINKPNRNKRILSFAISKINKNIKGINTHTAICKKCIQESVKKMKMLYDDLEKVNNGLITETVLTSPLGNQSVCCWDFSNESQFDFSKYGFEAWIKRANLQDTLKSFVEYETTNISSYNADIIKNNQDILQLKNKIELLKKSYNDLKKR